MNYIEIRNRTKLIIKKNGFIWDNQEQSYLRDDGYKIQWRNSDNVRELTDCDGDCLDLDTYGLIGYLYLHSLIITYC